MKPKKYQTKPEKCRHGMTQPWDSRYKRCLQCGALIDSRSKPEKSST
jgi:hypothetical protein